MTLPNSPVGLGVRRSSTCSSSQIDVGVGAVALSAALREDGALERTLCTHRRIVHSTAGAREDAPFDGQLFGVIEGVAKVSARFYEQAGCVKKHGEVTSPLTS